MNFENQNDVQDQIEKLITSADSPVGIDAKKTHVIIIQKLLEIEKRLEKKGYTYTIKNDGVYYDLSKNKEYGKL